MMPAKAAKTPANANAITLVRINGHANDPRGPIVAADGEDVESERRFVEKEVTRRGYSDKHKHLVGKAAEQGCLARGKLLSALCLGRAAAKPACRYS